MPKHLVFFLAIFLCLKAYGFGFYPAIGSRANALGGAGLLVQNAFCATNNIALMPWQKEIAIGFAFQNRFGISDLNQNSLNLVVPYKNLGYGIKVNSFGNNILKDQTIGASVAYAINKKMNVAAGFNYHLYAIKNYGNANTQTFEIAVVNKITENFCLAFQVFNPFGAKFTEIADQRLRPTARLGARYKINNKVNLVGEIEKNNYFKANFKSGIDYQFSEKINFCAGIATLQPQFTAGIGFIYKKINIETAHVLTSRLGFSHHINLIFNFAKKS